MPYLGLSLVSIFLNTKSNVSTNLNPLNSDKKDKKDKKVKTRS